MTQTTTPTSFPQSDPNWTIIGGELSGTPSVLKGAVNLTIRSTQRFEKGGHVQERHSFIDVLVFRADLRELAAGLKEGTRVLAKGRLESEIVEDPQSGRFYFSAKLVPFQLEVA